MLIAVYEKNAIVSFGIISGTLSFPDALKRAQSTLCLVVGSVQNDRELHVIIVVDGCRATVKCYRPTLPCRDRSEVVVYSAAVIRNRRFNRHAPPPPPARNGPGKSRNDGLKNRPRVRRYSRSFYIRRRDDWEVERKKPRKIGINANRL